MDRNGLRVQDLSCEQLRYLMREQFSEIIGEFVKRGSVVYADEPPAIRGKEKIGEFLGLGRKALEDLIEAGVFEGVILNPSEASSTYTAFPRDLRERYTAYVLGEYKPEKKRYFKPKA